MNNLFSIGEVSKIKEITIKALRYYHKMGILIPRYIDKENGYRYYSLDQFIYIDIIKGCRTLGISISELQEIFKSYDTEKLLKFLKLKKEEAERNIIKMDEIIKSIDDLNKSVEYSKNLLDNKEICIKYFDKRYIVVSPCMEYGDLKEVIYYSNLQKIIHENKLKTSINMGIIYNGNSSKNLKAKYVFNELEESNNKVEVNENIKMLPKGKYLTLAYNKENEEERLNQLHNYIEEHSLKVKSFIEIELLNDFFNVDSYNCEIQIFIVEAILK